MRRDDDKTNKMSYAPSKDSDRPWHLPRLISLRCQHDDIYRPLAIAHNEGGSVWADTYDDLRLHGAHILLCRFCSVSVLM